MTFAIPEPHRHHPTHIAIVISIAAAVLTAAFHVLLFQYPYGIPLAICIALSIIAVEAVAMTAEREKNPWARVFLIPATLALVAEVLYASETVRALGFLITTASVALFAFWLVMPRVRFFELPSLWPFRFFREIAFPFDKISGVFLLAEKDVGANGRKILFGLALAVPFLIVIGALFASADPLFKRATVDVFFNSERLPEYLGKFIRDFIAFFFLLGSGSAIVLRAVHRQTDAAREPYRPDRTILSSFLIALNLLFVIFLAFQFAYFFGGEGVVQGTSITYAEYARQGFFQLLWVAGIVFAITVGLYRFNGLSQRLTRELALVLILQTGVVIASAISRLRLYIDAFGLTVSRWWALAVVLIIAAVLLSVAVAALSRVAYAQWAKITCLAALITFSALLLTNVEGSVAKINVERFLSGKTKRMDYIYLTRLSSDAYPALISLFSSSRLPKSESYSSTVELSTALKRKRIKLIEMVRDWRRPVVSDYRAYYTLDPMKLEEVPK